MPRGSPRATVLVVDDDEGVRVLLRRQLASAGHTVLEANSGPEAKSSASDGWRSGAPAAARADPEAPR